MDRTATAASPSTEMLVKCWDDKCVAFQPESGNTHLLSLVFARILEKLEGDESDDSIVSALLNENLVADADSALEMVESARQEFGQLQLIR